MNNKGVCKYCNNPVLYEEGEYAGLCSEHYNQFRNWKKIAHKVIYRNKEMLTDTELRNQILFRIENHDPYIRKIWSYMYDIFQDY